MIILETKIMKHNEAANVRIVSTATVNKDIVHW